MPQTQAVQLTEAEREVIEALRELRQRGYGELLVKVHETRVDRVIISESRRIAADAA